MAHASTPAGDSSGRSNPADPGRDAHTLGPKDPVSRYGANILLIRKRLADDHRPSLEAKARRWWKFS